MAWDEWEQLKTEAARRPSGDGRMRVNQYPAESGPGHVGDLNVDQQDLARIGDHAQTVFDHLWDQARLDNTSVEKAARDLSTQGFAVGSGLAHVAKRWRTQLDSVLDACAHIANHMQVTRRIHAGDEAYVQRELTSIQTLEQHFDERSGPPGKPNPLHGEEKKDK
ncbi:hypothetical protein [Streptomyces sp. NPDC005012]|uniref:hypothetical protein n=1 Tax=unclassified Streptomyces TaxID=2593676 RepID=UPI0033A3A156